MPYADAELFGGGADVGKILAGIQVPKKDEQEFDEWLRNLGYPFVEETQNQAFLDFIADDEAE